MTRLGHDRFCDEVANQTGLLLSVVEGADLSATVPTAPDWSLADLLRHLGGNLRAVELASAPPASPAERQVPVHAASARPAVPGRCCTRRGSFAGHWPRRPGRADQVWVVPGPRRPGRAAPPTTAGPPRRTPPARSAPRPGRPGPGRDAWTSSCLMSSPEVAGRPPPRVAGPSNYTPRTRARCESRGCQLGSHLHLAPRPREGHRRRRGKSRRAQGAYRRLPRRRRDRVIGERRPRAGMERSRYSSSQGGARVRSRGGGRAGRAAHTGSAEDERSSG